MAKKTDTCAHANKNSNHDWYDKTHLVILFATFASALATAIFTGWLASRTNELARDSNEQLISATRAWVVPTGAKLDGTWITISASKLPLKMSARKQHGT
jgi:hypothetical protein